MTKLGFSQKSMDSLIWEKSVNIIYHINKLQEKNHIVIFIEAEK